MSVSVSSRSRALSELQPDELVIDLRDYTEVLQFGECVRNLSPTRRQSIWNHNVQLHHKVQDKTKLQHQIDDILLFLIILYGKQQYPNEEQQLISKLKQFVASKPFKSMKKYIQEKYFPLYQDKFVQNSGYFANMIHDYASTLIQEQTQGRYVPSMIGTSSYTQTHSNNNNIHHDITPLHESVSVQENTSIISRETTASLSIDALLNSKLEDRLNEMITAKFGELENKINELTKEVMMLKHAMSEEAKENIMVDTKNDVIYNTMTTMGMMDEITTLKQQMAAMNKITTRLKRKQSTANKHRKSSLSIITASAPKSRKSRSKSGITVLKKDKDIVKRFSKKKDKEREDGGSSDEEPEPMSYEKRSISDKEVPKEVKDTRRKKMKKWLDEECGMVEYYDCFVENGLDHLDIMQHVSITDLALLGVGKLGDRVLLMQHIHKLKSDRQSGDGKLEVNVE